MTNVEIYDGIKGVILQHLLKMVFYMLSNDEKMRYERQLMIFGEDGQEKLKNAKVAIVGLGGLGSVVAYYLAAAGIGTLKLIDKDKVELSNLNRQILHWTRDIGLSKTKSAKYKLEAFNPEVNFEVNEVNVTKENVDEVIGDVDVIVDCLDNFSARYVLDEYAHEKNIPLVHGAIEGFYGQATTIIPGKTRSLREIFPNMDKRPKTKFPVVGVAPGIIGIIEASETLKLLLDVGKPLTNKLLIVDLLNNTFEIIKLK